MKTFKPLRRVFFLTIPDVHILDLCGPAQILCTISELGIAPLETLFVGPAPKADSFQGLTFVVEPLPERLYEDDLLLIAGMKLPPKGREMRPGYAMALEWLKRVDLGGATVCGICTGTFLMGDAGLLDGKWATTHHDFIERLARAVPKARVVDRRLFVEDDNIITTGGVSSGIDMALHIVVERFGMPAALQVARENVINFRRMRNDPELSPFLQYREHINRHVHSAQDMLSENPNATSEEIADKIGISVRSLARMFKQEAKISIKQYSIELRIELARRILANSEASIDEVADLAGFNTQKSFHEAWRAREEETPLAYRRRMALRETEHEPYPLNPKKSVPEGVPA